MLELRRVLWIGGRMAEEQTQQKKPLGWERGKEEEEEKEKEAGTYLSGAASRVPATPPPPPTPPESAVLGPAQSKADGSKSKLYLQITAGLGKGQRAGFWRGRLHRYHRHGWRPGGLSSGRSKTTCSHASAGFCIGALAWAWACT